MSFRIWNKMSGVQLRVLHGHSRSVLTLDFGITWLVTGSVDEEIRIWTVTQKTQHSLKAVTRLRLIGHESAYTWLSFMLVLT
jgi:WD40 repeat protein